jgi:hypothetical protein
MAQVGQHLFSSIFLPVEMLDSRSCLLGRHRRLKTRAAKKAAAETLKEAVWVLGILKSHQ